MIQFQPAQEVKDALTGKKTPTDPTNTATTQGTDPILKPPLAMTLSESSKLAGLFKETQSATPAVTGETAAPAPSSAVTTAPESAPEENTAAPSDVTQPEPVTPPADIQPFLLQHEPTDPHGIHDEAHPDEPEPTKTGITDPVTPTEAPSTTSAQPESKSEEPHEPEKSIAGPQTEQGMMTPTANPAGEATTATPDVPNESPAEDDFRSRLQAALTKLDTEIAEAEAEETRLLSQAAKATNLVKSKKAERKQLEALRNLDPALLQSVFKVMQETEEQKTA
jgi:hypothetical protein